jgi:hypothetical protein
MTRAGSVAVVGMHHFLPVKVCFKKIPLIRFWQGAVNASKIGFLYCI